MREIINPKNVHWPFGYSHVTKVGDTVWVSGQLPIVMLGIYVTDLDEFAKSTAEIRKKYFGKYRPATTGLEISSLYFPEAMIEVEATAVIGSGASDEAIKPKKI